MAVRYFFRYLAPWQQTQARARFLDAGPDDGYTYELGRDGSVVCRKNMRGPDETDGERRP